MYRGQYFRQICQSLQRLIDSKIFPLCNQRITLRNIGNFFYEKRRLKQKSPYYKQKFWYSIIMHISKCCSRLATQNLIQNSIIWALTHRVHNPNIKVSIAQRADQENTVSMLIFHIWEQVLGRFPFVRTGWLDHCRTSQFANEIGFFQRVFAEKPSPWCILFTIWLIWLDSFDLKWNSQYDRDGLASQFWQMESILSY